MYKLTKIASGYELSFFGLNYAVSENDEIVAAFATEKMAEHFLDSLPKGNPFPLMVRVFVEKQLFDYDGWDGDEQCMIFYDCTLKVQVGDYSPRTKFDSITVQWEKGKLELYDDDDKVIAIFNLRLTVGDLCQS